MTYSRYELKYCECCGGLGLRRQDSGVPYCRDCEQMLQNLLITPGPPLTGSPQRSAFSSAIRVFGKPEAQATVQEASDAC